MLELGQVIYTDLSMLDYCLTHLAIYISIQFIIATICFLVFLFRKDHKRIVDKKLNISLSLTIASAITGLLIPVITYITQFDYWRALPGTPHNYQLDITFVNLYTLVIPFLGYIILSICFYIWYRNLNSKSIDVMNQSIAEKRNKNLT